MNTIQLYYAWCEACGTLLSNKEQGFICCYKEADIITDPARADALRAQTIINLTIDNARHISFLKELQNVFAGDVITYDIISQHLAIKSENEIFAEEESKVWREWAKENIDFDKFDVDESEKI